VIVSMCGIGDLPAPDREEPCCYVAADSDGERCSCWRPVYTAVQETPRAGAVEVMPRACGDCAYRPDSPERTGDPHAAGDARGLEELAASGQPFWCHDGMQTPLRWEHPFGAVAHKPGQEHDYDPPIVRGVPYRRDGRPAALCQGWAVRAGAGAVDALRDDLTARLTTKTAS
jgi:hypothetical protein